MCARNMCDGNIGRDVTGRRPTYLVVVLSCALLPVNLSMASCIRKSSKIDRITSGSAIGICIGLMLPDEAIAAYSRESYDQRTVEPVFLLHVRTRSTLIHARGYLRRELAILLCEETSISTR